MKIYVASSWRNDEQPHVVRMLRAFGHEVYDFKNPAPGDNGFHWGDTDPGVNWREWSIDRYRERLSHPIAEHGFKNDMDALHSCDACVLVLPCGRSAHLELGYAVGAGKKTAVLLSQQGFEPELMYKMCGLLALSLDEIVEWLANGADGRRA